MKSIISLLCIILAGCSSMSVFQSPGVLPKGKTETGIGVSFIDDEDEFYFVHAYYPLPASDDCVIGTTGYGIEFPSVIGYKNLIATQFHPEKSGTAGLALLTRWLNQLS